MFVTLDSAPGSKFMSFILTLRMPLMNSGELQDLLLQCEASACRNCSGGRNCWSKLGARSLNFRDYRSLMDPFKVTPTDPFKEPFTVTPIDPFKEPLELPKGAALHCIDPEGSLHDSLHARALP